MAAVAAVALSGCWFQPGFGPERQSSNPFETSLTAANVDRLEEAWSVPTTFGSQPLVAGANVYTSGQRMVGGEPFLTVLAVDRRSGTPRWQRDLPNGASFGIGTVLSVADGRVLTARLADGVTVFETLDPRTGATIATVIEPRLVDPATVAVSDTLVAYRAESVSGPADLVVRRRDTLTVLWTGPIARFTLVGQDPVLIAGDHIYVHDEPAGAEGVGEIRAFAAGGCGAATCSPTSVIPVPFRPVDDSAVLLAATDDGHLLVGRTWSTSRGDGGVDLLALTSDGTADWILSLAELGGVAVAGDTVFAVGSDAATPAFDRTLFARSGSSTWRADESGLAGAPIVAGGLVHVEQGRADGTSVLALDADGCGAASCSPLTSVDIGPAGGTLYGMSVTAGTLFASHAGGQLRAFTPTG